MHAILRMEMDHAAFTDGDDPRLECARILRALAERVEELPQFDDGAEIPLWDFNGNEVGYFQVNE